MSQSKQSLVEKYVAYHGYKPGIPFRQEIRDYLKQKHNVDVTLDYVKTMLHRMRRRKEVEPDREFERDSNPDGSFSIKGNFKTRPVTDSDVFKFFNLDPDEYDMDGDWTVKEWSTNMKLQTYDEQGNRMSDQPHCAVNYGVSAKFKKKLVSDAKTFDALKLHLEGWTPPVLPQIHLPESSELVAVINMYDAHLDKTAIGDLDSGENSLEKNINRYMQMFLEILEKVRVHNPKYIIMPVGNDLFHTNGTTPHTKKGTLIEYLCDPQFAYEQICLTIIKQITFARQVAPVCIPIVPGNHDQDKVNMLGFWLDVVFGEDPMVEFSRGRNPRKYYNFGKCLLGFDHGDKVKQKVNQVPNWMATERPTEWATSLHRKFYCGDIHHQSEFSFQHTKDMPGVEVSFLRATSVSDPYHVAHGYIGIPITGYAEIWDPETGLIEQIRKNYAKESYEREDISLD